MRMLFVVLVDVRWGDVVVAGGLSGGGCVLAWGRKQHQRSPPECILGVAY